MNMGLMIYNSFLEWMITLQFYDYISNLLAILCFGVPCSDQGLKLFGYKWRFERHSELELDISNQNLLIYMYLFSTGNTIKSK